MNLHDIKTFIDAMATSDLGEMEVTRDGWTLKLSRSATAGQGGSVSIDHEAKPVASGPRSVRRDAGRLPLRDAAADPSNGTICAPLAGVVHFHPAPGEAPFVTIGERVDVDATVCVIEAMKMFNAVRTSRAGMVEAILVTSGTEVEAGQPLVRIA